MKWLCYVHSSGSLIVRKYLGDHDHQQMRRFMRADIGVLEADNIEEARTIARQLVPRPAHVR